MKKVSVEQIIRDERNLMLRSTDSYLLSYPEFTTYFANLETITSHSLIIGAHFTYGWMPTILRLRTEDPKEGFATAVAILNEAKHGRLIGEEELEVLRDLINNSVVGASKLLHFVNPHVYAIWDSNVYTYINGKQPYHYQVNSPRNYVAYLDNCQGITRDKRVEQVHASMNEKIGYEVTAYRALELVMYASTTG